jgi:hypothetical protein
VIKEEEKNMTKHEYFESSDDELIEKFPGYNMVDLNLLSEVRTILQNKVEKERIKEGFGEENEYLLITKAFNEKTERVQPEETENDVEHIVIDELF